MSNRTGTFDINEFDVILGVSKIDGFAKDSFLKIVQKEPNITAVQGVDGETTRVKTNKNLAEITFILVQSSLTNDILSGYLLADMTGNVTLPLYVKDRLGKTVVTATALWITKNPDLEYGSEGKDREWTLEGNVAQFVGGNRL